jgi:hypothetical protein
MSRYGDHQSPMEDVAGFGAAKIMKDFEGYLYLVDGSEEDRKTARDWANVHIGPARCKGNWEAIIGPVKYMVGGPEPDGSVYPSRRTRRRPLKLPPKVKSPTEITIKSAWFHVGLDELNFYLLRHDTPPEEMEVTKAFAEMSKLKWKLAILGEDGEYHVPDDRQAEEELRKHAVVGFLAWREEVIRE